MLNAWLPSSRQVPGELRQLLNAARTEADRLGNPFVASEHLLLALLTEPSGEPRRLLVSLGIRPTYIRSEIEAELAKERVPKPSSPDLPLTGRAKSVLEHAVKEAGDTGRAPNVVHVLLGLMAVQRSVAAQLLRQLGANLGDLRRMIDADRGWRGALNIYVDDTLTTDIYEQIVVQIKEAVATGKLRPGSRLPPVRQLAEDLEIAPGTVARAYAELESSGIIVTDGSRGTFVSVPGRRSEGNQALSVRGLLRPGVIAAYHRGASSEDVRRGLELAMTDIYPHAP